MPGFPSALALAIPALSPKPRSLRTRANLTHASLTETKASARRLQSFQTPDLGLESKGPSREKAFRPLFAEFLRISLLILAPSLPLGLAVGGTVGVQGTSIKKDRCEAVPGAPTEEAAEPESEGTNMRRIVNLAPRAGPIARRKDLANEDHGKVSNLSPDDLEALRSYQNVSSGCLRSCARRSGRTTSAYFLADARQRVFRNDDRHLPGHWVLIQDLLLEFLTRWRTVPD